MPPSTRSAHASMLLSTTLVATSFPVVGQVAGALDSSVLTLLRFAAAAALFLPIVVVSHGRAALPSPRGLARYALLSAPLVAFFVVMFEALRTTTPINTAALFTLGPSFAALFAFLLVGERLALRQRFALAAATAGATWVVSGGEPTRLMSLDLAGGDLLFVAGTASLGLYSTLVKRLHRGEPLAVMTFWTLVTGAGWLLLASAGDLATIQWSEVAPQVWLLLGYLAAGPTLGTFLLSQRGVASLGPTRSLAYTFLNPALVVLLAELTGASSLDWRVLPGIALTVAAMVALQRNTEPRTPSQPINQPAVPGCVTP